MGYPDPSQDIETLLAVVKPLLAAMLDSPEDLSVIPQPSVSGTVLRVTCSPDDISKLIGKGGRNARALRTIFSAISRRNTLDLNIVMPTPELREDTALTLREPALA